MKGLSFALQKGRIDMRHNLKISVSKDPGPDSIVQCRTVTLRERLLTRLLGKMEKVMIVIPGNCVNTLSLSQVKEGDEQVE